MTRALKIGVWFALAAVVGLASSGRTVRTGSSPAPPAAKMAPAPGR